MKKGDKLTIIKMAGKPNYDGRDGYIEHVDDAGQIHGTWGGCAVIPGQDEYKIKRFSYYLINGYDVAALRQQLNNYKETDFYKYILINDDNSIDDVMEELKQELSFYGARLDRYAKQYDEDIQIKKALNSLINWEASGDHLELKEQ